VAGPKTLEHLVDVVTMVEQDDAEHIARDRRLTISKNRRGRLAGPVLFTVETTGAWRER
jgi:predicted ATP-dependent serine protease